jgi:hypothetical protein
MHTSQTRNWTGLCSLLAFVGYLICSLPEAPEVIVQRHVRILENKLLEQLELFQVSSVLQHHGVDRHMEYNVNLRIGLCIGKRAHQAEHHTAACEFHQVNSPPTVLGSVR